jgi:geranylgeranyl reductase family protein
MEKHDVIVIGAGPAGACAAYLLAKSGVKVLVIDKEHFPRCKPCAGGLTAKTLKSFDFSITEEVRYVTKSIVVSYKNRIFHKISGNKTLTEMVERSSFDHFFIKKAVSSGAMFLDGVKVEKVVRENEEFTVETHGRVFHCKYLIGADGANSIVNRTFNIVEKDLYGFAVETNCYISREKIGNFDMTFDFGAIPNGYLWIFPKDRYLCIGAYTANQKMKHINDYLIEYIEKLGLKPESKRFTGHIIPFYGINYKQPDYPCILVGDAAGFADYWTGEGVYYAVKSGTIAAEVILSSINAASFQSRLLQTRYDREIIQGLRLGYHIGKIFYSHLPRTFTILMTFLPSGILYEAFSRGFTYDQIFSKIHVILSSLMFNSSRISNKKYYK